MKKNTRYEFRVGEYVVAEVCFPAGSVELSWETRKELLATTLLAALEFAAHRYAGNAAVEVKPIVRTGDQWPP